MTIEQFPRAKLSFWPTPIEHLGRLTRCLGGPDIFVKRDDVGSLAMAGNKLRKLEFLLGDALQSGCRTIVTSGALQSNHARLTAAVCAKLGLECHLVLKDEVPDRPPRYHESGNRFLDELLGAKLEIVRRSDSLSDAVTARSEAMTRQGRKPYVIALGGSTGIGSLGYVACADEIARQQQELGQQFSYIFLASGSGGTHAGLVVGARSAGLRADLVGVTVSRSVAEQLPIVLGLVQQTTSLLAVPAMDLEHAVRLDDSTYMPGYGLPNAATCEAVRLCAETEGLLLDPVYTGKAMAALISRIRSGGFKASDRILFVHTGGAPALFAYEEIFRHVQ